MASSTLDGLRTEITAAIAAIDPVIAGLDDLALVSLTDETLVEVNEEQQRHRHRRELLQRVLDDLNALEEAIRDLLADGYPELPPSEVTQKVFLELEEQLEELEKAFAQFKPIPPATKITVTLGPATDKPE